MNSIKGLIKSKVFWFNAITGLLEITSVFTGVIPTGTATLINCFGNVALRFLTTQPLSEK